MRSRRPFGLLWKMLLIACPAAAGGRKPTGLLCELLTNPDGVALKDATPEFSWIVPLTFPGDMQAAYQIQVGTSKRALTGKETPLWNTGKVEGSQSLHVPYAGPPLSALRSYVWRARTWNREGKPSEWSEVQRFFVGDLEEQGDDELQQRKTVVRYPLEKTEVSPVRCARIGKGHTFFDFGQAAYGTVKIEAWCIKPGQVLTVHLGERPDGKNRVHRRPGGTIRYRKIALQLVPGKHTYTVKIPKDKRNTGPGAILMHPDVGEVLPFRYCEIEGAPHRLRKRHVKQVRVHYPFDDKASAFRSSDKVLNDVWELCKYTMKATSFCGVYVDGDRERIPYEADAYINQLGHYCTDKEFTLARYSHEYLILYPSWPTEWALHSVLMAWADAFYSGSLDSAREFYPDLKIKTLLDLAREDGLISTHQEELEPLYDRLHMNNPRYIHGRKLQDIVDWPLGERDGYVFTEINTVVNAFHYKALLCLQDLAKALGKEREAADLGEKARRVYVAFNEKLFDSATGLYVDGEGTEHSSLHANLFPLAFGLVPEERKEKVAAILKDKGMACSVYAAQYLMEALYEAGEGTYAHQLMTDTESDRSWPHMIYDVGTTIALEAWDNQYKPNQDWNHAWGAAPANIIPRKLMGVEPLELGFRRVRIRPQLGDLSWAEMTLPTVRGSIEIRVEKKSQGETRMDLLLPANMEGEVHLPASTTGTLLLDGQTVETQEEGKWLVVPSVASGKHVLLWKPL